MSTKRVVAAALVVVGGLSSHLGVAGLQKDLSEAEAGGGASLIPLEAVAILLGLVLMIGGGLLLARSFLDLD